jgi:predicted GH43/DUF377 family glycosyl hydrolase
MFQRVGAGPLLTREHVPDAPPEIVDATSVFNPGAMVVDDATVLLCRVQTRGRRTWTWPATDTDGLGFRFLSEPVVFTGLEDLRDPADGARLRVFHNFDLRLTRCEDQLHAVSALDTDRGGRLALWRAAGPADDGCGGLSRLTFRGLTGSKDSRNGVLFPRRVGGRYLLLDRPNTARKAGGPPTGDGVRLLASSDLHTWEPVGPVFAGHPHYWDELVGAGPPPVETEAGWLLIYHGVATHFKGVNVYQAGAVLLDRTDPSRVVARTRDNILEPREPWELTGQVPNVVFPSGLTVAGAGVGGVAADDAGLNLYYGAADTCIGLATARVGDVVAACT